MEKTGSELARRSPLKHLSSKFKGTSNGSKLDSSITENLQENSIDELKSKGNSIILALAKKMGKSSNSSDKKLSAGADALARLKTIEKNDKSYWEKVNHIR